MNYYPPSNIILSDTVITRERSIPSGLNGSVIVSEGEFVRADDVVISGKRPADFLIVDVASALKMQPDDERLNEILTLEIAQELTAGELLGTPIKGVSKRLMPKAPEDSVVRLVEHGRVILEIDPQDVEIEAGLTGQVVSVDEYAGLVIETTGTLIQCAWGNGQRNSCGFAFEPGFEEDNPEFDGLEAIADLEITLSPYRGKCIVLMRPITALDLDVIAAQELGGLVAPSMSPRLIPHAMEMSVPIILTEGFGDMPPAAYLYELLYERINTPAVFDARTPSSQQNEHPEILIPINPDRQVPEPAIDRPLEINARVRIRRAPHAGRVGLVVDLPEIPLTIANGLRVLCAQIKLQSGELVMVPRANLEMLGEAST